MFSAVCFCWLPQLVSGTSGMRFRWYRKCLWSTRSNAPVLISKVDHIRFQGVCKIFQIRKGERVFVDDLRGDRLRISCREGRGGGGKGRVSKDCKEMERKKLASPYVQLSIMGNCGEDLKTRNSFPGSTWRCSREWKERISRKKVADYFF